MTLLKLLALLKKAGRLLQTNLLYEHNLSSIGVINPAQLIFEQDFNVVHSDQDKTEPVRSGKG